MKTRSSGMRARNLSSGSASLLEPLECRTHLALALPPSPTILNNIAIASAVTADFDGDGLTDLVASSGKAMLFYKGAADGSFADPVATNLPTAVGIMTVGRFNGDLRPDIASIAKVPGSAPNKPAVGLIVRTMYFDPATGRFEVGARLRVGDASDAAANCPLPRIVSGNFVSGVRDEIVVALGAKTDVRLLRMPDRTSIVQDRVLLSNDNAWLLAFAVGTGLPDATPGRAQLASVVSEAYSTTLLVTKVYGDHPLALTTRPMYSAAGDGFGSVAIGDLDGDSRTDVVLGGSTIIFLRHIIAFTAETFAPPQHIQLSGADFSSNRVESISDINDDGRADIIFEHVTYIRDSRLDSVTVQPMVAIQDADGHFDAYIAGNWYSRSLFSLPLGPWPSILDTGPVNSAITARVGTLGRPAIFNFGNGLTVGVMTEELFGPIITEAGAIYDGGPGGSLLKTGTAYAYVRDQDPMRGGHVVRVEFILDLNRNGEVDDTDPTLCIATTPPAPGSSWLADFEVPLEWNNGTYTLFVRAIDNDGLASAWSPTPFAIYPI